MQLFKRPVEVPPVAVQDKTDLVHVSQSYIVGMEQIVLEQQLKALRAQINPHFLQNTFMFLSQTLQQQSIDRSVQIIAQLSSYLCSMLANSDKAVLTMEDELAFAEEYLAINKLIFHNIFSFTIDIGDEVDTYHIKVPSMLLQPLLENAIKHGIRYNEGNQSKIDIKVYKDAYFVYCATSNTLATNNISVHSTANHKSKGLEITEQRLALLYKNADHPSSITASITDDCHKVVIRIPL